MAFFLYHYERPARKHYRWWHNWAVRSRLKPMIEKARMIQRRFDNIITYLRLRITKPPASRSTPRFNGSSTPRVVSATRRTSSPLSTSTVGSLCHQPLRNPKSETAS